MSSPLFSFSDAARSRLRATVATIEREIARLPEPARTSTAAATPNRLAAAFTALVEQLGLGPEPEVRECPACHHIGMRAATRCGYCWMALVPPTGREGIVA